MMEKLFKLLQMDYDKCHHAFYGLLIYSLLAIVSPMIAIIVVAVVGIGKEVYDNYTPNHTSDKMDAVYTVIPSLVMYILGVLYEFLY